jgi:hypothetical protein
MERMWIWFKLRVRQAGQQQKENEFMSAAVPLSVVGLPSFTV